MKSYFEERGGTYTQVGDVLIPDLVMDSQPEGEIGIWGWRRKRYLKEHKKGAYNAMLLNGTLTQHLIDTNAEALDLMDTLVKDGQGRGRNGGIEATGSDGMGRADEQHPQPGGGDRPK